MCDDYNVVQNAKALLENCTVLNSSPSLHGSYGMPNFARDVETSKAEMPDPAAMQCYHLGGLETARTLVPLIQVTWDHPSIILRQCDYSRCSQQ